jgi:hypothetical protein
MSYKNAIVAGVIGSIAMSLVMVVARMMGMPVAMELMLGTMLGGDPSGFSWLLGFAIHVMMGAMFALAYAGIFKVFAIAPTWLVGLYFGLGHAVIAGLMLGAVPLVHPLIPELLAAPGIFMSALGAMGVGAFIMLHALFGAIVGAYLQQFNRV